MVVLGRGTDYNERGRSGAGTARSTLFSREEVLLFFCITLEPGVE